MSTSSVAPTLVWTRTLGAANVSDVPDLIELLGERIRTAREAGGMSQRELADRVHVDTKTVSRWENGRHQATRRNANRLADALGVGVEELGGELPAPLGRTAGVELVEGGFEEFRSHVADLHRELAELREEIREIRVENVAHLQLQTRLLEGIEHKLGKSLGITGDVTLDDRLAEIRETLALDTLPPPREPRSSSGSRAGRETKPTRPATD